jgi:hypothetical protein
MAEATEQMKRPRISDELTKKRALEMFWPQFVAYQSADYRESDRAYTERQILSVLSAYRDGYSMARDLENHHGWAEDRELVDLMDHASAALTDAHKELVRQWVTAYRIAPDRKIGDNVTTTVPQRNGEAGSIVGIYEDEARYGVRYPDQPETSSYIVNFEDVKDAPSNITQD